MAIHGSSCNGYGAFIFPWSKIFKLGLIIGEKSPFFSWNISINITHFSSLNKKSFKLVKIVCAQHILHIIISSFFTTYFIYMLCTPSKIYFAYYILILVFDNILTIFYHTYMMTLLLIIFQYIYKNINISYEFGARKIGVTTLSGCLPIVIILLRRDSIKNNYCVDYVNDAVTNFNKELRATTETLKARFPDLRHIYMGPAFYAVFSVKCDPQVPAILVFGDSSVDTGNNNKLLTIAKANHLPYGRDFVTKTPTGRFSNGKLVIDFISESLGFTSYQPAFLSEEANGENLLIGCNFASAGSGYCALQSLDGSIPFSMQLVNYVEYKRRVVTMVGEEKVKEIQSNSLFILNIGITDFLTYFLFPLASNIFSVEHFSQVLLASYTKFIEESYELGARKIGITTVSSIGCLPIMRTLLGRGSIKNNECINYVNDAVENFNKELSTTTETLKANFPELRLMVLDTFHPFLDIVQRPSVYGFNEAGRGCCGLGLVEFSSLLCNEYSLGTCPNASQYIFWDSIHQTEATNKILATSLLQQGAPLIP